jgi:cytochrome P450 family 110
MIALPPRLNGPDFYQLYQWATHPIELMEEASRRYGECFTASFPNNPPFVFTSNPEMIREVFTGKPEDLYAGVANRVTEPLLGSHSLLLMDGEEHIRERRLMTPPFHGERMLAYGHSMRESATRVIERWPLGQSFTLHKQFQDITLDIILKTVFGLSEGELLERFRRLFVQVMDMGSHPAVTFVSSILPAERVRSLFALGSAPLKLGPFKLDPSRFLPSAKLSRLTGEVNTYLFEEIARRRTEGLEGREDVLSMLMQARDEDGQPLSDQHLRDEAVTLLAAGHETTATALSWAFHHVLQRPEVEQRLREELHQVAGTQPLDPAHVNRLEYLDAALKETLRLLPVIPAVARVLQRPMKVGSWELPAGVAVLPCIYLTQRRADLWEQPERFNPERFLGKRVSPYEYFPFGGGARRCLGMAFASYEMKIIFAEVLRRVRLRPATPYTLRVARRGVTLAPADAVPVLVDSHN